jgi:hypothetical protein
MGQGIGKLVGIVAAASLAVVAAFVLVFSASALRAQGLPDDCTKPPAALAPATERSGFGPWEHLQTIEHARGLVYRDIRANRWPFLKAFYVAFIELEFALDGQKTTRLVRYCSGEDEVIAPNWDARQNVFTFGYQHRLRGIAVNGEFTVRYRTKYGVLDKPCAGRGGDTAFARKCARWVPALDYSWQPGPAQDGAPQARLTGVTAYYRLDYGDVAITLVSDPDDNAGAMTAAGVYPIVVRETSFTAVGKGAKGKYDNIHPVYPVAGRRTVVVPGCRAYGFDCTHLHWRWGGSNNPALDPLVDPFTGAQVRGAAPGSPYLVQGQTIKIAVTADNGEGDVRNPMALVDGETLASAQVCKGWIVDGLANTKLKTIVKPVVVWYIARSERAQDTFFGHGFFALEDLKGFFTSTPIKSYVIDNIFEQQRQVCDNILDISGKTSRKAAP